MNNNRMPYIVASLFWLIISSGQAMVISTVCDAEIRSSDPNSNYGAITSVSALSTADPFYRKGYVKFDANGLNDAAVVTNINAFTMYFSQPYARSANFYLITGSGVDSWDESAITWNNAPGNGPGAAFLNDAAYTSTYIGQNVSATGWVDFVWYSQPAMDAVMHELNTGDRTATIAFMHESTSRLATFASRENPSGHPLIQMDLGTAVKLYPVQDAEIKLLDPETNYGTNTTIKAARDTDPSKGYIQFDASGGGRVESIDELKMVSTYQYACSAQFYLITGTNGVEWSESGITWSNAPGNDMGSAYTFTSNAAYLGYSQAVAQYSPAKLIWDSEAAKDAVLNALNGGTRKATIAFSRNGDRLVSIASRENGAYEAMHLNVQQLRYPVADTAMTDAEFFGILDGTHPGMADVLAAFNGGDAEGAKALLCGYYRTRGTNFWRPSIYTVPDQAEGEAALDAYQQLVDKTGYFLPENWLPDGTLDWRAVDSMARRMYFFSSFGRAYQYSGDENIAKDWISLYRAWIAQMQSADWTTMTAGIRLRTGWGDSFSSFIHSPSLDDESLFLFLKSFYEQAEHLRNNHSDTSNWLTFEMQGLYGAGVLFPEWAEAAGRRGYAVQTALDDLGTGWLPDGISIELTLGYGQFFVNYIWIADFAETMGLSTTNTDALLAGTEPLYEPYVDLMTPDRKSPAFNDNRPVDVPEFMEGAVNHFPGSDEFRWAASNGAEGTAPTNLAAAFPYAGYIVVRSGWETNANYLCFDAGPVGYRHAHQDKLSIVLWSHGRQILFDPGRWNYDETDPYSQYSLDTFSHSTGLVDNRPQRRYWYQKPDPNNLPYQPLGDFNYELGIGTMWAAGSYTKLYGRVGSVGTHGYPYTESSNFYENLGNPAKHFRQIVYIDPDIFIVQDLFVPILLGSHDYEIRWQLDSLNLSADGSRVETADGGQPNLAIIPLRPSGVNVQFASEQDTPEVLGWKVLDHENPATTLRHLRSGTQRQGFLTLLLPLNVGRSASEVVFVEEGNGVVTLDMGDDRAFMITPASNEAGRLAMEPTAPLDADSDGLPDWWEKHYYGSPTAAETNTLAANGINTLIESYTAGLDPTEPSAVFKVSSEWGSDAPILSWDSATGRTYTVFGTTNLMVGFQKKTNLPWTGNTFTGMPGQVSGFYKLEVKKETP